METRYITVDRVYPQFLMTDFSDGDIRKFMMVYTGSLSIGHGTGDDLVELRIEHPLIAWYKDGFGNDTMAIYPFEDPGWLEAAVASAALSNFKIKDTHSWVSVWRVRADIKKVGIRRMEQGAEISEMINALVLSMETYGKDSLIAYINYNVTVVGKFSGRLWIPRIMSDPNSWTGGFDVIVNPPVKWGNPVAR